MTAPGRIQQGYLLLADISGYTVFLTGNELEHAQAIIEDLVKVIIDGLAAPFTVVKLEGDAVFAYAPASAFAGGERILDTIDACYIRFSDRLVDMARATTCTCRACSAMQTLDLKFLAHWGEFVVHRTAGVDDLAGPDVILIHRLLKNRVVEETGIPAYALITRQVLERIPHAVALKPHSETYEAIGEVRGGVHDLRAMLQEARRTRSEVVTPEDADLSFAFHFPVPPSVAWEYWVDPRRSRQWTTGITGWEDHPNAAGRMGAGATAHCAHGSGSSLIHYLDWRPFDYVTTEKTPVKRSLRTPPHCRDTAEFRSDGAGGTTMAFRIQLLERGLPARLLMRVMRPMVHRQFAQMQRNLDALFANQAEAAAPAPPAPVHS